MVNICDCGDKPSNEELKILVRSLKPGKKLPPLTDFFYPTDYIEQLIAENYLDGLLEGFTLELVALNSIGKLKDDTTYLGFNENKGLKRIYRNMCDVIKRRGLNLKFEHEYEVWTLPPNEIYCDLFNNQVRKNDDGGLLLRNYKTCNHVGEECDGDNVINIGLRINGTKIECIDLRCY